MDLKRRIRDQLEREGMKKDLDQCVETRWKIMQSLTPGSEKESKHYQFYCKTQEGYEDWVLSRSQVSTSLMIRAQKKLKYTMDLFPQTQLAIKLVTTPAKISSCKVQREACVLRAEVEIEWKKLEARSVLSSPAKISTCRVYRKAFILEVEFELEPKKQEAIAEVLTIKKERVIRAMNLEKQAVVVVARLDPIVASFSDPVLTKLYRLHYENDLHHYVLSPEGPYMEWNGSKLLYMGHDKTQEITDSEWLSRTWELYLSERPYSPLHEETWEEASKFQARVEVKAINVRTGGEFALFSKIKERRKYVIPIQEKRVLRLIPSYWEDVMRKLGIKGQEAFFLEKLSHQPIMVEKPDKVLDKQVQFMIPTKIRSFINNASFVVDIGGGSGRLGKKIAQALGSSYALVEKGDPIPDVPAGALLLFSMSLHHISDQELKRYLEIPWDYVLIREHYVDTELQRAQIAWDHVQYSDFGPYYFRTIKELQSLFGGDFQMAENGGTRNVYHMALRKKRYYYKLPLQSGEHAVKVKRDLQASGFVMGKIQQKALYFHLTIPHKDYERYLL